VGEEGVVHVLEEEGCVVKGVEGYAVGSRTVVELAIVLCTLLCWCSWICGLGRL
jgi:hypothetical protein